MAGYKRSEEFAASSQEHEIFCGLVGGVFTCSMVYSLSVVQRILDRIKRQLNCMGFVNFTVGWAVNYAHNSSMEKKYGGLVPKKKPLISKDPERAFFDSADWVLCKQGAGVDQKTTVDIETLRPKLQRTPHQQLPPRRPACTN